MNIIMDKFLILFIINFKSVYSILFYVCELIRWFVVGEIVFLVGEWGLLSKVM